MPEINKDYIKSKIQEVLKVAHSDSRKFRIVEHPDRLQYSCPICGDSEKFPGQNRGMRGNLYYRNLMQICFNEGCNISFLKLLKRFNVEIDIDKKVDIYNFIDTNVYFRKEDNYVIQQLDKLINIEDLEKFFNENPNSQFRKFGPVKKNSRVYQHLKYDRYISNFENLYEGEFKISKDWIEPVIVILNRCGNKVLGMQIRNLKKEKSKRMFKVFNFEKLYNMLHPEDPLDEIEALSYNKYSNFYNILNVDWEKPVTIFEGYLDSLFYPNSIGAIGINSTEDMDFLLETDDNIQLHFFFDQDRIGIIKAKQKLEAGYTVFLWQRLVERLLKNKKDGHEARKYALSIKDLNKLAQEMKSEDPYNRLRLYEYFSNDNYDKVYLDETLYPKNTK